MYQLCEVCESMKHLPESTIRRAQPPTFQALPGGIPGLPPSWAKGGLPSRQGTSSLQIVPAAVLLVLDLLVCLISKALLGEVHFTRTPGPLSSLTALMAYKKNQGECWSRPNAARQVP
jgi:hypothetical protein